MKKQTKPQENESELDPNLKRLMHDIEIICEGESVNHIIGALSGILSRMIVVRAAHSNINYIEDFLKHYKIYLFKYYSHYKKFHSCENLEKDKIN